MVWVIEQVIGIDLAWGEGLNANETGLVVLRTDGRVMAAGWAVGVDETIGWIQLHAAADCLIFVDAPLLVLNADRQRCCEREVGQRYGRWKVSANSTNLGSARLAGVRLRKALEEGGWSYDDGTTGPPTSGRVLSECYPYTTTVGAPQLGYSDERPRYKRKPRGIRVAQWRPERAINCDQLLLRMAQVSVSDPPMDLTSHALTRALIEEPSPLPDRPYKHREDLLDASLCAWTASLWLRRGFDACQVLGAGDVLRDGLGRRATIIAPARGEQR